MRIFKYFMFLFSILYSATVNNTKENTRLVLYFIIIHLLYFIKLRKKPCSFVLLQNHNNLFKNKRDVYLFNFIFVFYNMCHYHIVNFKMVHPDNFFHLQSENNEAKRLRHLSAPGRAKLFFFCVLY